MNLDKDFILAEIQRIAEENGGKPPGRARFAEETNIAPGQWARYWARWGDALEEAGFPPNSLQGRLDDDTLLRLLVSETRRLGHMPTIAEWTLHRYTDRSFPSAGVYQRLGSKRVRAKLVADYCRDRPEFTEVLAIVEPLTAPKPERPKGDDSADAKAFGFVYLLKSGRFFKVGRTNAVGRREYELAIHLPERATLVHKIRTDDPAGIEAYWHRRFADRRKGGEWFALTASDIRAFKSRRSFM